MTVLSGGTQFSHIHDAVQLIPRYSADDGLQSISNGVEWAAGSCQQIDLSVVSQFANQAVPLRGSARTAKSRRKKARSVAGSSSGIDPPVIVLKNQAMSNVITIRVIRVKERLKPRSNCLSPSVWLFIVTP